MTSITDDRLLVCSRKFPARWPKIIPHFPSAFSLIEVTIALSVAGFCLLAILGLLQTGVTTQRATTEQTAATGLATMIFADLVSAAGTNPSPRFQINLANSSSPQTVFISENGTTNGSAAGARYRASLDVRPPAAGTKSATGVRILITWPAQADPSSNQWPSKYSGAVETWTALDRN